ncbi:hypothetical protein [Neorhizobium sp. JUb45]|uniref:hypothetical protein n=1 Tax=unclassified Neorhizobium TaxID=2629175 RepID=UPI0010DAB62F|nr:hypothetical protein [Neorhizobium sp. JUb45]TCQ98187.1 hypothetical protein EDF70_11128 [Neorhizobium sp. JUb45]
MKQITRPRYSLEALQQAYTLNLSQASDLLKRFGSDKASIDKIMKRCQPRVDNDRR